MRKVLFIAPVAALVLGGFASEASAQTTTATATFQVTAINEVSVSGNPAKLIIDSKADIDAGVTDATTTWAITTNDTASVKVTGQIDAAMPTNTSLSVTLAAPATNGTSAGEKALGVTAVDLVTGMSQLNETGLGVTYKFTATQAAAVVDGSRTVTYTVTTAV